MVTYREHYFRHFMSDVEKYNIELLALNDQWDNIKLLCEINCPEHAKDILSSMATIQESFSSLQKKLISTLTVETLNKMEQKTVSKAQVAVDILIRNLYERTADVGFLATDDDICRFVGLEEKSESDREYILKRLRNYVAKYSVYEEIVILDKNFTVLANLDQDNQILGKRIEDPILQKTLSSNESFVESFKASPLQSGRNKSHIFSRKILKEDSGEVAGVICLCFRFENEMAGIFKKLATDYDGSVIMIIDENNKVLASSDDNHVPVGVSVEPVMEGGNNAIVYYRGIEYISKTVCTNGYQGYCGLGWKGHVMIPIELAFKEKVAKALDSIDNKIMSGLMGQADSFSKDLKEIMENTKTINQSLRQIVYNGQIIAKDGSTDDEYLKLKPLLNYINKIGTDISQIFAQSVKNLFATVISTSLSDVSFLASLCIDIMDRNLYERADDCRWWALNSSFRKILAHNEITDRDRKKLTEILAYINSLYTVYSGLFLFDRTGKIIAVSNSTLDDDIGKVIDKAYIKNILGNSSQERYFVSRFEATELYDGKYTYVYGASITDNQSGKTVGGIGIVFDSEFQFKAMIQDSLQSKEDSFAAFADRNGNIISSTSEKLNPGDRLKVPKELLDVKNGDSHSEILVYDGCYYSVGCVCSSSYREYKSSDGYQNDVIAFVFENLADFEQIDKLAVKHKYLEQADIPYAHNEKCKKLATFIVDGRLLAMEQENVLEAVEVGHITAIPECNEFIKGVIVYRKQYVTVLDTRFMFKQSAPADEISHVLIVKLSEGALVALAVDQLNNVLEISEKLIKPVPSMGSSASIIKGVACIENSGNRMILVLDEKRLADQLNPEIRKINFEQALPLIEEMTTPAAPAAPGVSKPRNIL